MKVFYRLCKTIAGVRIVRAMAVGAVALVIQTFVFEMLGIILQIISASSAAVIGAEFGILTNFYLNNRFSFNDRQHRTSLPSRLARFHLVVSGSVFLQWLFVFIAEHRTENLFAIHAAYVVGVGLGFIWNYSLYLLFVWRHVPVSDKNQSLN